MKTSQIRAVVQASLASWLQVEVAQVNLLSGPMGQRRRLQGDKGCVKWNHASDPKREAYLSMIKVVEILHPYALKLVKRHWCQKVKTSVVVVKRCKGDTEPHGE